MIQAILHGKIPSNIQNSEDVLTSTVFGTLEYMSSPELLFRALSDSINLKRELLNVSLNPFANVRYLFWPRLQNCELDLLVVMELNKEYHLYAVEAKYFSDKSSKEDNSIAPSDRKNHQRDQLAREIEDLYEPSTYRYLGIQEADVKSRTMIYITLENYLPIDELEQTMLSIETHKKCLFDRSRLYWMSWKSFYPVIVKQKPKNGQDHSLLRNLAIYLEKRNLKGFTGFTVIHTEAHQWAYEPLTGKRIDWTMASITVCSWTYTGGICDE